MCQQQINTCTYCKIVHANWLYRNSHILLPADRVSDPECTTCLSVCSNSRWWLRKDCGGKEGRCMGRDVHYSHMESPLAHGWEKGSTKCDQLTTNLSLPGNLQCRWLICHELGCDIRALIICNAIGLHLIWAATCTTQCMPVCQAYPHYMKLGWMCKAKWS